MYIKIQQFIVIEDTNFHEHQNPVKLQMVCIDNSGNEHNTQ